MLLREAGRPLTLEEITKGEEYYEDTGNMAVQDSSNYNSVTVAR